MPDPNSRDDPATGELYSDLGKSCWEKARERLAYSIRELSKATSIGRSTIYAEIAAGRLKATHIRRRTVIMRAEAQRWLESFK